MLSSKSFIAYSLTFRSLIHFRFIFVYDVRRCSYFTLLHVAVQFSQHHLLKRLSFVHCVFQPHLPDQVIRGVWVYLWAFYPIPLICVSVFASSPDSFDDCSFVVLSEVREPDSSRSVFLSQDCFDYLVSFVFPYKM